VTVASSANLIVASAELNLVRLLVGAMRTADIAAAKDSGAASPAPPPAQHVQPRPVIEPRTIFYPTPLMAPRQILHSAPCVDPSKAKPPIQWPECSHRPKHTEPVFQPPWKILPWPQHTVKPHRFKPIAPQPDILVKGLLIDIFV
jgi:hypothetical protein